MKKKGKELEFISRINPDGKSVMPLNEGLMDQFFSNPIFMEEDFEINQLSITHDTYIASGMLSFVVKIKEVEIDV